MKIYSMTATFGKLEHETLTLQPGLNVIHAPNEWGKSTWCAFLVAMLYGLETRARSTTTTLSDKEHYAPWSGSPMSGSMDICWQGRDITIQRKTKGRSIFGDFKAFETHTGLPVTELTASNCGAMLLGVEKSVFSRSAFIRQADLPVTQDEALRHRLNALVTTGDDSGTAETLEKKLRDLRNRCRYNRTGALPQAEGEAADLIRKLRDLDSLHTQAQALREQQAHLELQQKALENHRAALAYAKAREDALHVVQAKNARDKAQTHWEQLEQECAALPTREEAVQALDDLHRLQHRWADLQAQPIPVPPVSPEVPAPLAHMTWEEAREMVGRDTADYPKLRRKTPLLWLIPGLLCLIAAVMLLWMTEFSAIAWILLAGSVGFGILAMVLYAQSNRKADAIQARYGGGTPADWQQMLERYVNSLGDYQQAEAAYRSALDAQQACRTAVQAETCRLCGSDSPAACQTRWTRVLQTWDQLADARQDLDQARRHTAALEAMADDAPPPAAPDDLTWDEETTRRLLGETAVQLRLVHSRLGQCQGQMEAIGQRTVLEARLEAVQQRIGHLEDTYAALTIALDRLQQARSELQRRFSPRITQSAQTIMDRLTEGRYHRLMLDQDLNLHAAARNEDTLRTALWRSDGTTDQLYLALRLAVAQALTPNAPLILDDALIRFDDQRLRAAMAVLTEEARNRQVILFTCHSRELSCQ